jgi:hypothetical protein
VIEADFEKLSSENRKERLAEENIQRKRRRDLSIKK